MSRRQVVVLGAGVGGLAAATLLARTGHRVTLVERDGVAVGEPAAAPRWDRAGVPHFMQPHAFIPRGRSELRRHLPDVLAALLDADAREVDARPKLPGEATPEDEELQYLAVRRPVIEWALRRACLAEPTVQVAAGAHVDGLLWERGRLAGVRVDGGHVEADVVGDALGRRTPIPGWLRDAGHGVEVLSSDCHVVYYSRYYQLRPGAQLPDGPWFLSPRGDLGYLGYATFPGDNGTFAAVLAVPARVPEWRALKDATAFEAAVGLIPGLRQWVDPDAVRPITGVLPMAGLRNSLLELGDPEHPAVLPLGDAHGHTDPVLAHGLAFALAHAGELAAALAAHADPADAGAAYLAATGPALAERYDYATALDAQRRRMWVGEPVDFAHRDGDYALFTIVAGGAAASVDPDAARAFLRRIGLLDSTRVLDEDIALQQRIERVFAELTANPRPPAGPDREQMLASLDRAVATPSAG